MDLICNWCTYARYTKKIYLVQATNENVITCIVAMTLRTYVHTYVCTYLWSWSSRYDCKLLAMKFTTGMVTPTMNKQQVQYVCRIGEVIRILYDLFPKESN